MPSPTRKSPLTGLAPVAGRDPLILVLGSFPSRRSLERREYYAHPQNQFWQIMERLYGIDRHLPYPERSGRIKNSRIALWDVIRACSREGSADNRIQNPVFNDIADFLTVHSTVRFIAVNGRTAMQYYRRLCMPDDIPAFLLPSTSPANARFTLAEKVHRWEKLRTPEQP